MHNLTLTRCSSHRRLLPAYSWLLTTAMLRWPFSPPAVMLILLYRHSDCIHMSNFWRADHLRHHLMLYFHLVRCCTMRPTVMSSVWHGLVDTLRLLPTVPPAKPLTDEERDTQLVQSASEKATLDQALEKLSTLIALRKGENVTLAKDARESLPVPIAPVPVVSVSTPGSAGTPVSASGHNKRKRPGSTTASPAPMVNPNLSVTTGTTESTLTSVNSSTPLPPRSATPNARDTAGRQQRKDQLPLLAGRKVAFKQPKGKGDDSGADDEWILAMIKSNMDKEGTRYEVQDADDASQ